ncbi:MAG TPA: ABC transporter permease [Anaerolineae bacterium]|nr:ABC transporter permease [Anaerolineae bacterium]
MVQKRKFNSHLSQIALLISSVVFAFAVWYLFGVFSDFPSFILPSPIDVWNKLLQVLTDGSLLINSGITLYEVLMGMSLGVSSATVLGYFLAKSPSIERLLSPYIVASQSIPTVAIAPLLVIWFGPGLLSKILVAALIVFFPVLVNTIVGIRSVPKDLYDLLRSLRATRWQILRYLEVPAAMPVLLGGIRVGVTLAVIGAVVGEFVGSDRGLGFLINVGKGMYDTSLVFVAMFTLITMAMILYGIVTLLESRLLSWQKHPTLEKKNITLLKDEL